MKVECSANQLSSVHYERGWLLGTERTSAFKKEAALLGPVLVGAAFGDRELVDRFSRTAQSALPKLRRQRNAESPEGPPVVTNVSLKTLNAFLALPREPEAAVRFIETYGVLRPEDTQHNSRRPQFVREFRRDVKQEGKESVVLELEGLWYAQGRLQEVLYLYGALSATPPDRQSAKRLADILGWVKPELALSIEMFLHLRHAKVAIDFDGPRATPLIATFHVLPGLYALVWQAFLQQTPLASCQRCATAFAVSRKTKLFCSEPCEQRFKQARYREAQAQARRLAAQGRTPKQIATAMGREVELIRRWVRKPTK